MEYQSTADIFKIMGPLAQNGRSRMATLDTFVGVLFVSSITFTITSNHIGVTNCGVVVGSW
jgi:hypothetical protein